MAVALLVGGIASLLVGLLAIGFGIPVKEFSFGNTLILAGAVAACTGLILLGLWMVVRELRNIAQRLGPGIAAARGATLLPAGAGTTSGASTPTNEGFPFGRDEPALGTPAGADPSAPASPPPWVDEAAARERTRGDLPAPEPVEAPPPTKPKRNLLFSSSSRKERERAQARATDPATIASIEVRPATPSAPPVSEPNEMSPPASFDDAWPQAERSKTAAPPLPRSNRTPSTFTEPGGSGASRPPPAPPKEEPPPVTVLKSGVVDGMAYSLYSDGSIEAQMPEGMMRFASIDELRAHLDQRP